MNLPTLKRKKNLNATLRPSQRRFLASIALKGQNQMTDADYAAGDACGMSMTRPDWSSRERYPWGYGSVKSW